MTQRTTEKSPPQSVLLASLSTEASEDSNSNPTNSTNSPKRYQILQKGPKNFKKQPRRRISRKSSDRHQFRNYLKHLKHSIRNRKTLANRMDDELKKMEMDLHRLNFDTDPRLRCRYPNSINYNGPIVEPDVGCYAMTANAYARAGLGKMGAELAEVVHQRCETYSQAQRPNAILRTACLNAWIRADEWEKADEWLAFMEEAYRESGLEKDAPDTITYTHYLEGLAASNRLSDSEIVRRCDETLQKMTRLEESGDNPFASPNRFSYIAAMKCRARRQSNGDGFEMVKHVESLLREMEARYEATQDPDWKPNNFCYVPVINAFARCKGGMKAAEQTEALLLEQKHKYSRTGDPDYLPLDGTYTACFTAYARVEPQHAKEASLRVRQLFTELESSTMRKHSPHAYTAAINGIVIDATPENLEEAELILRRIPHIDSIAYQCVIKAYAKSGNAAKATELLWELQEHAMDPSARKGVRPPDVIMVAACINSWVGGYVKDIDKALDHAESLVELITNAYRENNGVGRHRHVEPWVFENVIRLWSVSKRSDAGERAERLIEVMQEISGASPNKFDVSYNVYTLALDAWATSGHKDAGNRAANLLDRMQELAEAGKIEELNNRALSSALVAITKSKSPLAVEIALKFFNRILDRYIKGDRSAKINARTYTSVLNALARSDEEDAAAQAIELFRQVRDLREQGFKNFELNTIAYNCILNLLARRGLPEQAKEVLDQMSELAAKGYPCAPDTVSYSCFCRAYSNSNNADGAERTLSILSEVEEKYRDGNNSLKPDSFLYNAVLTTLARTAQTDSSAAEKANELLTRMELSSVSDNPILPDLVSYSNVCQAYAVSSVADGAEKAEEFLQRAEELAADGSLAYPDGIFYSAMALAFTRNQVPNLDKAERVIQRMEELQLAGRRNIGPSTQTYNFLLSGWAHSRSPDKLKNAMGLLEKLKHGASSRKAQPGPDVFSYNWVILTAARSTSGSVEKAKASFDVALDLFREIHNDDAVPNKVAPNAFTYAYFLRACNSLLPEGDERERLTTKAFTLCQQRGLVSKEVWVDSAALIPEFLKSCLDEATIDTAAPDGFLLPEDWTRNLQCKYKQAVRL